jgi:hypothetical protein
MVSASILAGRQWFMLIILATQEADIRRIKILGQPRPKKPISKKPITKKGKCSHSRCRL